MPHHAAALPATAAHTDELEHLLSRRSAWPLKQPGPQAQELAAILQAAAVAPDHAGLCPWRFKVVQGEHRRSLLQQVLAHPLAQTEAVRGLHGKYTLKLTTAPTVIVLAAHIQPHPKAPEFEQLLAAGAAVMNMLHAAQLLDYSGFWSSTPEPLGGILREVMRFEPHDQMIGLLNLGTPATSQPDPAARPSWQAYAEVWQPQPV